MRDLRCLFGKHILPLNGIMESYGAVFLGGWCPRCDRLVQRKFIYNIWDPSTEKEVNGVIQLTGANPQLVQDLEEGRYVWS